MTTQKAQNHQFEIKTVVKFVAEESRPEEYYFLFSYKIKIANMGSSPAKLVSRHWIITDGLGRVEEVQGPGVVGLQPTIAPQQYFEYESACPLNTKTGSMRGYYHFVDAYGEKFIVEIPEFYLVLPSALH